MTDIGDIIEVWKLMNRRYRLKAHNCVNEGIQPALYPWLVD